MKVRPILFQGAMVRALIDGTKTQTRRVVKLPHMNPLGEWEPTEVGGPDGGRTANGSTVPMQGAIWHTRTGECLVCPHGQPGDQLWVRETWGVVSNAWDDEGFIANWTPTRPATSIHEMKFGSGYYSGHIIYAADGNYEWAGDDDGGGEPRSAWHPSIHMPRVASRIQLEIVSVRVERLRDISGADSKAEGIKPDEVRQMWLFGASAEERAAIYRRAAVRPYHALWEEINGAGSWAANPWVWVVEFKRVASCPIPAQLRPIRSKP